MCSSGRGLCASGEDQGGGASRSRASRRSGSGSHYALCALGAGLVALGVVMIIWTVVPLEASSHNGTANPSPPQEAESKMKTSSVAFVLVGAGAAMLLLALFLGFRNKRRTQRSATHTHTAADAQFVDHAHNEDSSDEPPPNYTVPSYDEAVGSGQYPIRQSNLRNSTTHLPSYEDLVAAVENETHGTAEPDPGSAPTPAHAPPTPPAAPPQRSSSRASRILRPLRVRRIKSEKLHHKDIRLNIQPPPAPGSVTIEPLTPPPQYEDKPLEF